MEKDNKQLTPIKVSETDKISDSNFEGFWVLGFDSISNKSVHATMSQMKGNKGDSAFVLWQKQPGNAGKTYEEYVSFNRQPATDAATEVLEKMSLISEDASAAIEAANTAAGNAQDAADNVQDGKTPILESVNAQPGDTPSGDFTANGVDALGNPKYILNLTLPAGKDGQPAVFEQGTTTTLNPSEEARVDVVENGLTPEGNPKYLLNFFIPRGPAGPAGTGTGNVLVDAIGLVSGKKYLFVPDADDSTAGTFVEYVAPEIPEQVQPDWDATEGKGAILNKPGNATADSSGLMSADQFQKLEKLNPSYLSNAVTGKKVEYTDAGKLLFEGKEAFAVDADNELTLAGKKLSELGGGGTYEIPSALLMLDPSTVTSDEIKVAVGGDEGFNAIVQAILNNDILYLKPELELFVIVSSYQIETTNTNDTNIVFFISVNEGNMMVALNRTKENIYSLVWETNQVALLTSTSDTVYFKYSTNDGELMWNSNNADTDVGGRGPRYAAYSRNHNVKIEDDGDGTKALMNDGIYKDNIASATKLQTARNINGVPFDGTKNISIGQLVPIMIEGGTDLNDFTTPGMYFNPSDAVTATIVNVPIAHAFSLLVEKHAGYKQTFTVYGDNFMQMFVRNYDGYSWSPWYKISLGTSTNISNLNVIPVGYDIVTCTLNTNTSITVENAGMAEYSGRTISVYVLCGTTARTITIPTTGNYISMCGSSYTCPANKWVEFNLTCVDGKWHIAKLEQE